MPALMAPLEGLMRKEVLAKCNVMVASSAGADRPEQIDALYDQPQAARARRHVVEGELLGAQVRALVVSPYLEARHGYTELLDLREQAP